MSKEITIKENYSPVKIKDMTAMANVLKAHVVKHKLYTPISGKNYVHVDGWAYAGGLMGLFPKVTNVENLSSGTETKWKADVEIVDSNGKVMGVGFALCSNKENKKTKFDEYAVLSMAQTRAVGRAYRNLIGWVMKLSGYESTPSEEMHKVGQTVKEPTIDYNEPITQNQGNQPLKKGQVLDQNGKPCYLCSKCDAPISEQEYGYSMKIYNKSLCREDQKSAKKK